MTNDDEVDVHLATAHNRVKDARDVLAIGKFEAAVSMSYYAAFHAAKSILVYFTEETKTHQGTSARFHFRAVHSSDFPAEVAGFLEQLRLRREDADYEVYLSWNSAAAKQAISKAERFVNETDAWFSRHRPSS